MAKYYKERIKKEKSVLVSRIVHGVVACFVVGVVIVLLRQLITSIPLAMLFTGAGAFFVSLFVRPSYKAVWHSLICAGCSGLFLLNLCPFVANVYLFEGYKAAVAKRWDIAVKYYRKALRYDSHDGELNFYTGFAYMKLKNYTEAAHHFKKSLETKLDPSAFNNLGNIYLELGELEKAEKAYKNALYTQVSRAYSLNNLGAIYQKMGYLDESYKMFKEALEASPKYEVARKNLRVVENLRKRYAYIKERYGKEFLHYFFTAETYLYYKRADKAKEFLIKAADVLVEKDKNVAPGHPDWGKILPHVGVISQIYSAVGANLVKLGQIQKAISVYETALNFRPKNIKQLYEYIASLYMRIGDKEKAQKMLEKAKSLQ